MDIDAYRTKIAALLSRRDIASAGAAAVLAAHCVHVVAEEGWCEDEVRRLEEMAGIGLDPLGNYIDLNTPDE